jgi:hypothetical protein
MITFGDFKSFNSVTTYDCMLQARQYSYPSGTGATNATTTYDYQNYLDSYNLSATRGSYGLWAAGTHAALGETQLGRFSNASAQTNSTAAYAGGATGAPLSYPNAIDNSMVLFPIWLYQSSPQAAAVRGMIPGVWVPCHTNPANNEDTLSGSGALAGKTFIVLRLNTGTLLFETSDTWDD